MHELLGSLPMVPLVDTDIPIICRNDEVMHLVVDQQVRDKVLFGSYRLTVKRDCTPSVVMLCRSQPEAIKVQMVLVPANEESLLNIKSHTFDPVAHLLEFVETVVDKPSWLRVHNIHFS